MPEIKSTPDVALRIVEARIKGLSQHLDRLYEKGKADGWPKEVMNYIMWFEHEVCRLPQEMPDYARAIRKGFARDADQRSAGGGTDPAASDCGVPGASSAL